MKANEKQTDSDSPIVLEVRDLSIQLGGQRILEDINLDVRRGTIHALLGPNGAGKTTLIRCLTGGMAHRGKILYRLRGNGRIGYVPQLLEFDHSLPMTVADFLMLMLQQRPIFFKRAKHVRIQVKNCLEKTDCAHLAERLIGGLSGGELRRVLLAQALSPIPEVLLLDEPASNIDEVGARAFEQTLLNLSNEHDIGIVLVGHDISTIARIADRVTGIKGRVTWSGPGNELLNKDVLRKIFGAQALSIYPAEEKI